MTFENRQQVMDGIEAYVAPDTIVESKGLDLDTVEGTVAVNAIQSFYINEFRTKIVDTLETRYLEALYNEEELLEKAGEAARDRHSAEVALGRLRTAEEDQETIDNVRGEVDYVLFSHVLTSHGWSNTLIKNNWRDLMKLATSPYKKRDWPQDFSLPDPESLERDHHGHLTNTHRATIDSSAFLKLREILYSKGPNYTDQLRAIKSLMPTSTPMPVYHTFKMWEDFAGHCLDDSAPSIVSTDDTVKLISVETEQE